MQAAESGTKKPMLDEVYKHRIFNGVSNSQLKNEFAKSGSGEGK